MEGGTELAGAFFVGNVNGERYEVNAMSSSGRYFITRRPYKYTW